MADLGVSDPKQRLLETGAFALSKEKDNGLLNLLAGIVGHHKSESAV